jgi:hypothetical protein
MNNTEIRNSLSTLNAMYEDLQDAITEHLSRSAADTDTKEEVTEKASDRCAACRDKSGKELTVVAVGRNTLIRILAGGGPTKEVISKLKDLSEKGRFYVDNFYPDRTTTTLHIPVTCADCFLSDPDMTMTDLIEAWMDIDIPEDVRDAEQDNEEDADWPEGLQGEPDDISDLVNFLDMDDKTLLAVLKRVADLLEDDGEDD